MTSALSALPNTRGANIPNPLRTSFVVRVRNRATAAAATPNGRPWFAAPRGRRHPRCRVRARRRATARAARASGRGPRRPRPRRPRSPSAVAVARPLPPPCAASRRASRARRRRRCGRGRGAAVVAFALRGRGGPWASRDAALGRRRARGLLARRRASPALLMACRAAASSSTRSRRRLSGTAAIRARRTGAGSRARLMARTPLLERTMRRRPRASAATSSCADSGALASAPPTLECQHRAALGGAELAPCLHELAPLLEHVAAPIGALDRAPDRVRERLFADLVREVRRLRAQIAEGRAEAVHGAVDFHPLERPCAAPRGRGACRPCAREHELALARLVQGLEDRERRARQRHAMRPAGSSCARRGWSRCAP